MILLQTLLALAMIAPQDPNDKHYDYVICTMNDGKIWQHDGDVTIKGNTVIIKTEGIIS